MKKSLVSLLLIMLALAVLSSQLRLPFTAKPTHRIAKRSDQTLLYRGRPLSYWRQEVKQGHIHFSGWTGSLEIWNGPPPWWLRGPAWTHKILGFLRVNTTWEKETFVPSWEPENWNATALFVALLRDKDPRMREFAAFGLGSYGNGPWREQADAALVSALWDEDEDVRWWAASSLSRRQTSLPAHAEKTVAEILEKGRGKENISYGASSLSDEEMQEMRKWTHLKSLNAAGTQITDAGLANLSELRQLVALDISNTRVTDAGLLQLSKIRSLNKLNLSGTRVSDAGLVHLRKLTNLGRLDLSDTAVTDAGVKELRRSLPKLQVTR